MKLVLSIITMLCCASIINAQVEWAASHTDVPTNDKVTNAFGMCETSNGVKQISIYTDSQDKWYVDVMHIVQGNKFTIDKTSELIISEADWAIQSDYVALGVYNVCHNLIVKNKIVFELVLEDPTPEPNHTKYWCYMFDEDGTLLNVSFGKEGKIVGNYMTHETCQPYDITQRIWAILKFDTNNTSSTSAINFPNNSVFPNPASQQLNINQPGEVIEVYNMQGHLIEQIPSQSATVNVSNYPKGHYLIKIDDTTLKFIKE